MWLGRSLVCEAGIMSKMHVMETLTLGLLLFAGATISMCAWIVWRDYKDGVL